MNKPFKRFGLFDSFVWSSKDSERAYAEGWDLFDNNSTGVIELQRIDETNKFKNDAEAAAFVMKRAGTGSRLHTKALLVLAKVIVRDLAGNVPMQRGELADSIENAVTIAEGVALRTYYEVEDHPAEGSSTKQHRAGA